jgi:capsid protein
MLLTLANDTIGTGPRLRLHVPQPVIDLDAIEDTKRRLLEKRKLRKAINQVEAEFNAWAREIKLAQKLRTMRLARSRDGEAFAVFTYNPKLRSRVKLDLKLVEADQVTSLNLVPNDPRAIDGIRFDEHMNPVEYDILAQHPGDDYLVSNWQPIATKAENVIHWFRADRPGQLRGIPEITPALPLYAQLRRYTLAVIAAAETAADFAAVITSKAPANGDEDVAEPYTELDIVQRMLLQLPGGMELFQLKAEQPTTTYDMFKRELLNEIARCHNVRRSEFKMPYAFVRQGHFSLAM